MEVALVVESQNTLLMDFSSICCNNKLPCYVPLTFLFDSCNTPWSSPCASWKGKRPYLLWPMTSCVTASEPAGCCLPDPRWPLPFAFPSVEMLIWSLSFIQLLLFIKLVGVQDFWGLSSSEIGSKSHFGWGKELEEKTNYHASLVSLGSQTKDVYLRFVLHIVDQAECILWCIGVVRKLNYRGDQEFKIVPLLTHDSSGFVLFQKCSCHLFSHLFICSR